MRRKECMKFFGVVLWLTVFFTGGVFLPEASAATVGILSANGSGVGVPVGQLEDTGLFTSVEWIGDISEYTGTANPNGGTFTPTLAQLLPYDAVLVYTNYAPADPAALGNVLAEYADAGGGLVIGAYSFNTYPGIAGDIMTHGYSPLINNEFGYQGMVSGTLDVKDPDDPIFSGIKLSSVSYTYNQNAEVDAIPDLDTGATLLADDGDGIRMIARNSSGNIIGINICPMGVNENNEEFFKLLGNSLLSVSVQPVPLPGAFFLLSSGLLGLTGWRKLFKKGQIAA